MKSKFFSVTSDYVCNRYCFTIERAIKSIARINVYILEFL